MIGPFRVRFIGENTALVSDNGLGINGRRNWSTDKDLCHDFVDDIIIIVNHSILCNSRIRKDIDPRASPSHPSKGIAGTAYIVHARAGNLKPTSFVGKNLTGRVEVGANSIRRFL